MLDRTENTIKIIAAVRRKKKSSNDVIRLRKETFQKLCQLEEETGVPIPEIVDILICYGIEKMENTDREERVK